MENKYYTNRHYRNTDKIRIAISNMNKDMREISEYCDKLENIIKEVRELLSKYNDNESNYYVPINIALDMLDLDKEK